MPPELKTLGREELLAVLEQQYEKNETLHEKNETLHEKIETLQFENNQLKKLIFGSKGERFVPEVNPQQTSLDFGQAIEAAQPAAVTEKITYEREKKNGAKKPSRQLLPAHLPRLVHDIQPTEDVTGLVKIGEEITEELEYTPGKLFVNKYVRSKYAKPEGEKTKVLIGKLPQRPLPKCIAGPQLLSSLIIAKFIDHLPLYRQSQMFKRLGIDLADATIGDWVNAVGRLLRPLQEAHKKQVLSSNYLMADETPIAVLESDNPGSTHKGFYWAYYDPVNKSVLFDYRPGRGKEGPKAILKNFKGHLQTDGYAVYDEYGHKDGITLMHCWAHARRKFVEAQANDRARADYVLAQIQKLYALERQLRETGATETDIITKRRETALPVIEGLKQWMITNKPAVMPKSLIGKAIDYTLSRIDALKVYTTAARLQIDNNLVENSIRPIALGRKNYLFAGSHGAAENAATFYSLFATCKAQGINPQSWLAETLQKIATHPINRIEELLPGWKPEPAASQDIGIA
jgi:transposase